MKYIATVTTVDDISQEYIIEIDADNRVKINDRAYDVDFEKMPREGLVSVLLNQHSVEGVVEERGGVKEVLIRGELYTVKVQDERSYRLAQAAAEAGGPSGEAAILSPMPGNIVKVPVAVGDAVRKKQTVVILESMKMENELKAPRDGIVLRIKVEPGTAVEKGQVLVVIGDQAATD